MMLRKKEEGMKRLAAWEYQLMILQETEKYKIEFSNLNKIMLRQAQSIDVSEKNGKFRKNVEEKDPGMASKNYSSDLLLTKRSYLSSEEMFGTYIVTNLGITVIQPHLWLILL